MEGSPAEVEIDSQDAFAVSLQELLIRPARSHEERLNLQAVADSAAEGFFPTALALLRSADTKPTRRTIYTNLIDHTGFLLELARPDRFSRGQALELCRELMTVDSLFDLHLARLLPRRYSHDCALNTSGTARILDLLHEISSGPRLILVLSHLTHHPDQQIASKATLLIARRIQNSQSVENYLKSSDPRVRANTVEALWNVKTTFARRTMRACLQDDNNRVVGNALFGLHLLGDEEVTDLLQGMLRDPRPAFRQTAAWVMGQIGRSDFRPSLLIALQDAETRVRQSVRRALKTIRECTLATQQPSAEAPPFARPEAEAGATKAGEPEGKPLDRSSDDSKLPQNAKDLRPDARQNSEQGPASPEQPPPDDFEIRLDGTYTTRRSKR